MATLTTLAVPRSGDVGLRRGPSGAARRTGWWLLLGGVLLSHALATLWLQHNLVGWGSGEQPMPPRMEVAFVQALAPAAPPIAAPGRSQPLTGKRTRAVARAASAPEPALALAFAENVPRPLLTEAPTPPAAAREPEPADPLPPAVASLEKVAPIAPAAVASAAPATAFEWPPSTRLTYALTGNYRGEVNGNARVQWVRQGQRYQVHLDVAIGPSFAPLISRRMTSDGELGEGGLVPRRYDEATRLPFQPPRRVTLQFTPEQVTLANGSQVLAPPGLQDTASQFVQLTWLFTTRPDLLRAGNSVTLPLALPRRVGTWVYDVLAQERLATPIGAIDTYHLKPRVGERRPGSELSAEVWFAPTLQYLPVRIRIQQDTDTFVDLVINAAPLQAAPDATEPR